MSIETLSLVMIFCEGICIVTVRKDTRTICWTGAKMSVSPGARTPLNLPSRKTTPRSYCRSTRSEPMVEHQRENENAENVGHIHDASVSLSEWDAQARRLPMRMLRAQRAADDAVASLI